MTYRQKCIFVDLREIERFLQELKAKGEKERNTGKPMTAGQIAEFFQIHRYEVYRWVREEGLPVMRLSARAWRFDPAEVKKWMRKKKKVTKR